MAIIGSSAAMGFGQIRSQILSIVPENISRVQQLGEQLAFREAAASVVSLQELLEGVKGRGAELVPDEVWQDVGNTLRQAYEVFERISTFTPTHPNAAQIRDGLIQQANAVYAAAFRLLGPLRATIEALSDSKEQEERISIRVAQVEKDLGAITEHTAGQMDAAIDELRGATAKATTDAASLSSLLEQTRIKAAEVVSTNSAENFRHASDGFRTSSFIWLGAAAISAIATGWIAVYFLHLATSGIYKSLDNVSSTQIVIAKISVLAIAAYTVNACLRNYNASKHNQTVNQHRSNAISSYRSLMEAATTPEHKDIILAQAASAVFAPQETGFSKPGNSGPEIPPMIINALTKPP